MINQRVLANALRHAPTLTCKLIAYEEQALQNIQVRLYTPKKKKTYRLQ